MELPVSFRREPLPYRVEAQGGGSIPVIVAHFQTDLLEASLEGRFDLWSETGGLVDGDMYYHLDTRMVVFISREPLEPGDTYQVVFSPGVEDLYGNRLEREVGWTVTGPEGSTEIPSPSPFETVD